jgi:hypothetical protein
MPGLSVPQRGGGFWERGQQHAQSAVNAYGAQSPKRKTELNAPDKTAGGGLMAGAGMAAGGYALGTSIGGGAAAGSSAGPYGAAIGAGVGIIAYLLS